jgi:GNAT superfamily N-acetyltransferase
MRIERDDPAVSAEDVVKEADAVMGAAGLSHRMLHTDNAEVADRLRPGLESLGWRSEQLLVMALGSVPPVYAAEGVEVREIPQDEMFEVAKKATADHFPEQADHADQLARSREVIIKAANGISLGGCIDGEIAGSCDFYDGGDVGQIEDVDTLERFRKRGVAKALVTTAIAMSQQQGHDLTFLVADDKDWPKDFYARLSFVPVGYLYEFRKTAKGY